MSMVPKCQLMRFPDGSTFWQCWHFVSWTGKDGNHYFKTIIHNPKTRCTVPEDQAPPEDK